jgi:hypothetical protein
MSNNEIGQIKGTVYQQVASGPLAGTGILATLFGSATTRLTPQSRILGVKSSQAGGADATTLYSVTVVNGTQAQVLAGQASVTIQSSLATDTSVITLYWCNEGATDLRFA